MKILGRVVGRHRRLWRARPLAACAAALLLTSAAFAANLQFAILGDRTGNAAEGVYERICAEVATHKPAFIINVGDTIEGLNDAHAAEEWDAIRPAWKPFGDIPLYLVPGNHDIWSPESERIWREKTGRPPHYSFDVQGVHITVLDNSRADALSAGEMKFLEEDLAAHADVHPKFVFFHRPFWLFPVKFQNRDLPFHQLMKRYGVDWVISGHVHRFDRSELDGVNYLMVGSSGGALAHGSLGAGTEAGGAYFGYAWVEVEEGKATVDFRKP